MDFDLAEYDQFEEIKFFTARDQQQQQQLNEEGSSFLVTLSSSSSGPTSATDEANCENDYVFLPSPPPISTATGPKLQNQDNNNNASSRQTTSTRSQANQVTTINRKAELKLPLETGTDVANLYGAQQQKQHQAHHPLMTINSNGGNPFYNLQQVSPDAIQPPTVVSAPPPPPPLINQQPSWLRPITETFTTKPIGVLDISANISTNPKHVASLMHQIITKSDSIYIAIPCDYCLEPVACPPSDISAWLNHMSGQHNCKVCPVCNKLVGLGPRRDLEIIKKHVMGHFDDDWLERRAITTNFTHGLQQHWFSGGRCTIKEPRSLTGLYNRN